MHKPQILLEFMVGESGLTTVQIQQIFKVIAPSYQWIFYRFSNINKLSNFTVNELKPSHAIVCGYMGSTGEGHVFLIAKSRDGNIWYVDPQINKLCLLNDSNCLNLIDRKQGYYILQSTM